MVTIDSILIQSTGTDKQTMILQHNLKQLINSKAEYLIHM